MIAYVHEAYVLAGARDRIDRPHFALALAVDERSNIDHGDFGEIQDAGGRHDHTLTPLRGAGPRKQTSRKSNELILISRFENCKTRARACAGTGLLTRACIHKTDRRNSPADVCFSPNSGVKADMERSETCRYCCKSIL